MENQAQYIQALLADKLDKYREKGNIQVDEYIQIIQKIYITIYHK